MAYLVVRMRGTVNVPYWADTTLESLNLAKKFRATIVPESAEYSGMLNKIRQLVAWCRIDNDTVKDLLDKKGRKTASQPLKETDLPKEYNSLDKLASDIANDEVVFSNLNGIKPWFALNPPRGGFKKSIKKQVPQNGILGENKLLIDLVKKMM
ncbi:MAG TPA: 50S ribosomal protein L30 [Nitrososphaeraceae archaeon]|jgi:large subunit ribosomal protein L30|nr:50S ribosomal protein L30 [Nitrososphaeraceae archaeon]